MRRLVPHVERHNLPLLVRIASAIGDSLRGIVRFSTVHDRIGCAAGNSENAGRAGLGPPRMQVLAWWWEWITSVGSLRLEATILAVNHHLRGFGSASL
jgi:hypothetical protein